MLLSADPTPIFNAAAVAHRTGLPAATFRAWERRYGLPAPRRGQNKQRSYSEQDVLALGWLRDRLAEGLTISVAVTLLREQLQRPLRASRAARPPATLAAELEQALLLFDGPAADLVLAEAFALYPLERVCLDVLQPMLVSVGERWHADQVGPPQEHFASSFTRRRLVDLLQAAAPPGGDRLAVAACAPDDWHEVGLLMVSLFLARRGWRVAYLGGSLPAAGLADTLARLRPAALLLSASTDDTAATLADLAAVVTGLPPPRPIVAFGGAPFEQAPRLREAVPGIYLGPNAETAAERLERAIRPRPPDPTELRSPVADPGGDGTCV